MITHHWLTNIEARRKGQATTHVDIAVRMEKRKRDAFRAYNVARCAIRNGASETDAILRDYSDAYGYNEFYFFLVNAVDVVKRFGADEQQTNVKLAA